MSKTYVSSLRKDAVIQVPITSGDIAKLHSVLLKHLDSQITLDDNSWDTLEKLCNKIDRCAEEQNLTELREVNF
jgi:hypothetical protein